MAIDPKPLYRWLDTDGDGTGTKNANGDYSGAAEEFYIEPPATDRYEITRLIVMVEDAANMRAEHYGTTGAALGTGVVIFTTNDADGETDLTDSVPVKQNAQWGALCYDVDVKAWGAGNELLLVRWTFEKTGYPIILNGQRNARLGARLNDNLTGLVSHYFQVQGASYENTYSG